MPSFDVVSEIDRHELANAIDQANRELSQRFDFKDTGCKYEFKEKEFAVPNVWLYSGYAWVWAEN